jgi:Mg-chelatase subunit ChlI
MVTTIKTTLIAALACLLIGMGLGIWMMLSDAPVPIPAYVQQQIKDLTKEKEEQVAKANQAKSDAEKAEREAKQATEARIKTASSLAQAKSRVAELERTIALGNGGNPGTTVGSEGGQLCDTAIRERDDLIGALKVVVGQQDIALTDAVKEAGKWKESSDGYKASGEKWEKAYNQSEAVCNIKVAALQSQLSGMKSAKWRIGLESFGAGLVVGQVPRLCGWSIKF